MRRTFWVLAVYLAVHAIAACASAPRQPRQQVRVWMLRFDALDTDLFCAEPTEPGDGLPQRCRQVGEIREFLGSLRAD